MDQSGRKSAASLVTQVVHLPGKWPEAPAELTEEQAATWKAVVLTKPHDWWGADTYPLLIEYVRAIQTATTIAKSLEEFQTQWLDDEEGLERYERLTRLQSMVAASLARLATKMRLSQQSRYDKQAAAGKAKRAGSLDVKPWQTRRD